MKPNKLCAQEISLVLLGRLDEFCRRAGISIAQDLSNGPRRLVILERMLHGERLTLTVPFQGQAQSVHSVLGQALTYASMGEKLLKDCEFAIEVGRGASAAEKHARMTLLASELRVFLADVGPEMFEDTKPVTKPITQQRTITARRRRRSTPKEIEKPVRAASVRQDAVPTESQSVVIKTPGGSIEVELQVYKIQTAGFDASGRLNSYLPVEIAYVNREWRRVDRGTRRTIAIS